jgi:hypothetical protein
MATVAAPSFRRSATPRLEPVSFDGPGLTSSLVVWAVWIALAAATWATNARTPLRLLYGVSDAGVRAGAGRVLVLLGWPVALSALPLVAIAVERLLARPSTTRFRRTVVGTSILAVALCATIALPGAINSEHVDAKPVNALAAVGVAIAFGLTLLALARTGRGEKPSFARADLYWVLPFLVLLFGALPWLLANLGFYVGDVPGLHAIFMSRQIVPEAGHRHLAAVHLGNHDGFDALLLALTSIVLLRSLGQMSRLRTVTGVFLALLIPYGLAAATSDWWSEQLVKRGTLNAKIPSSLFPSLSLQWAAIVAAAALVYLVERRGIDRHRSRGGGW